MRKNSLFFIIFIFSLNQNYAQSTSPKRELRGAWLSTVRNIDWPTAPTNTSEKKISDLIKIIDYLKATNINTVVFQVRPASDAMYASTIEPWSYWLTGKQGKAPSPFFDPLEIAIEESHKRGMELHAWINPYRVRNASYNLTLDDMNVAKQHPDWVLNINGDEILDPGLLPVREHVVSVITDIITRYDVDAIHFDDYFYLEGITTEDNQTFIDYPRGFTNKGDWRRDNVNELLRMIYLTIQSVAPHVKFGQSPPGIWKNGVPESTFGWDVYNSIYCDAVTWLDEQIIDYLAPQLYWQFGGGQDYGKLAPWWASVRNDRHIYPGLAYYRVGESTFDKTQIGKMVRFNREDDGLFGEVYFTSNNFDDNLGGVTDTLTNDLYRYPALLPVMDWKDTSPPDAPTNLRFDRVTGSGTTALTWDIPLNEEIKFNVIYRSVDSNFSSTDIQDPANILEITSNNYLQVDENFPADKGYFFVTALDRNNNESDVSNNFKFQPSIAIPDIPTLVSPLNASSDVRDTTNLVWNYAQNADSYSLSIFTLAADGIIDSIVIEVNSIIDTSYQITGFEGLTSYSWYVTASSLAGDSEASSEYSFTTAFPSTPIPLAPTFQQIDVALYPLFTWHGDLVSPNFRFQLSEGLGITTESIIIDTIITTSSISSIDSLKPGTFYAWRVNAQNSFGISLWSKTFQFKTMVILPETPELVSPHNSQNTLGDSINFIWYPSQWGLKYTLQISLDENFSQIFYSQKEIFETHKIVTGFSGETKYYWRVSATNNGGSSSYSETFSFTTGFPILPVIIYPTYQQLNREIDPILLWSSTKTATDYWIQLSKGLNINLNELIIDEVISDTSFYSPLLEVNTIYSWRVSAFNSVGSSGWSNISQFKTASDTILVVENSDLEIPKVYYVEQNFPNPFNPSTIISFGLPKDGITTLKIYNILGQEVAELVNNYLTAGNYKFKFDGSSLSSGMYIYRLQSQEYISIKKMLLVK